MAGVNFRVKTSNEWNAVLLRFKNGRQFDFECSTGIKVPNKRWSDSKQQVLPTKDFDGKAVNDTLDNLRRFFMSEYSESVSNGLQINSQWVRNRIEIFFNRQTQNNEVDQKVFLADYIQQYVDEASTKRTKNNVPVKSRTIQHYVTTKNKVLAFEEHVGRKIKLENANLTFHSEFIEYLENVEYLNPNTIGGYIDNIRMFCSIADKKGVPVSKDYKLTEFFSPSNKSVDIYLKETEINTIAELELSADYLDNARDWFIIGLRTGLRISDFLHLSPKNIVDGFLEKRTVKTDFPVIIPIHPQIERIMQKRGGNFPRRISDQKFNTYIKEICRIAGFEEQVYGAKMVAVETKTKKKVFRKEFGMYPKHELVSSHICRRSFATNLYGKIDTLTIMKITGHSTEKQFLGYIKITPKEYAERLKAYWSKTLN